jgi:hypothetical protein
MAAFQAADEPRPVKKPLKKAMTIPGKLKSPYKENFNNENGHSRSSPAVEKAVKKKKVVQKNKPSLKGLDADADAAIKKNVVKGIKDPSSPSKKKISVEKNGLEDVVGSPSSETPIQKRVVKKRTESFTTPSSTQNSTVQKVPKQPVSNSPVTGTKSPRQKRRTKITKGDLKGIHQSSSKSLQGKSPMSKHVGVVEKDNESLLLSSLSEEPKGGTVVQKESGRSESSSKPKSTRNMKVGADKKESYNSLERKSPSQRQGQ